LIAKSSCSNEVIEEAPVELGAVDRKQKVVTANDGAFQCFWNDAETAHLGVNFSYQKLTRAADLLALCLDVASRNGISQDDAFGVQLNSAPLVVLGVVENDELLPMFQHLCKRHLRPPPHASPSISLLRPLRRASSSRRVFASSSASSFSSGSTAWYSAASTLLARPSRA